jgi:hypothetical protein
MPAHSGVRWMPGRLAWFAEKSPKRILDASNSGHPVIQGDIRETGKTTRGRPVGGSLILEELVPIKDLLHWASASPRATNCYT